MPYAPVHRRAVLMGGAAFAGLATAPRLAAREGELFGIKLPSPLRALVPGDALDIAATVETLLRLERRADSEGLPPSPLRLDSDLASTTLSDSLYPLVMPRLVALIDRAERIDPGLAEQAGALLAQLHAVEHGTPPALIGFRPGSAERLQWNDSGDPLRLSLDEDEGMLALPGAAAARTGGDVWEGGAPPPEPPPPAPAPAPTAPAVATPAPAPPAAKPAPPAALSRARSYAALSAEYRQLFDSMELRPEMRPRLDWYLTMLRTSRPRYDRVAVDTGVPWHVIGIIHALEASFNFRAHLHNGDHPLAQRTRQVPAGRPVTWAPPIDWDWSAKDALKLLGFTGKSDWHLERTLYRFEAYNGFGYRNTSVASPYLWAWSTHYESGKFVADGRFNAKARSNQCGAAAMLRLLADAGEISV